MRLPAQRSVQRAPKKAISYQFSVDEFANFQINDNERPQTAMKEQQVHSKPFVADTQALLATNEGEFVAKFEQESFKMTDQRLFQFALGVL